MKRMEIRVDRKAAVKKIRTLVLSQKSEIESFRAKLEKRFASDFIPNHVERDEKKIGGVQCDILVPEAFASRRVMIYVHGGSFVGGSRESWRSFCAVLANAVSSCVIVPEFRLAPSYPYPSSIEDLEHVLSAVLESGGSDEIIVAADGSGASIAMGLLFGIEEKKRSAVSRLILFSPWLDLSFENPLIANRRLRDEVLSVEDLRYAADLYTYSSNLVNCKVSPLRACEKDFAGFPEVYIQCGEKEILLQQSKQLCELLRRSHITVTLDTVPGMMFMFQMADEFLAESYSAVEKIGNYINRRNSLTERELMERRRLMRENNIRT